MRLSVCAPGAKGRFGGSAASTSPSGSWRTRARHSSASRSAWRSAWLSAVCWWSSNHSACARAVWRAPPTPRSTTTVPDHPHRWRRRQRTRRTLWRCPSAPSSTGWAWVSVVWETAMECALSMNGLLPKQCWALRYLLSTSGG